MARLFICLFICFAVVIQSQAYTRSNANFRRFVESLLRDADEDECKSYEDMNPAACADLVKIDTHYCTDYKDLANKECKRSCSPCGPKEKAPAPAGVCEDLRNDCSLEYSQFRKLFDSNPCEEHPAYSQRYCRKYCGLCR